LVTLGVLHSHLITFLAGLGSPKKNVACCVTP
jgi:hypothetical protein